MSCIVETVVASTLESSLKKKKHDHAIDYFRGQEQVSARPRRQTPMLVPPKQSERRVVSTWQ